MSNTIIIDGNSIGHANHNGTVLSVGDFQVQAIFGVLKSVAAIRRDNPGWAILVLWDGRAEWRYELLPDYKGKRNEKTDEKSLAHKEAYKKQVPIIQKALATLGVRQMFAKSAEADDMASVFSRRLSAAGHRVKLVTGDKDWIQLVGPNVVWFDPIRDREVTIHNIFEMTGYRTPEQFLDGKCLVGDSSDCISGVGGIGEKGAPEFIAEFGSVAEFYRQVAAGKLKPKKKAHRNLCGAITLEDWEKQFAGSPEDAAALVKHMDAWPGDGRLKYERNRKLMSLLDVPTPEKDDVVVIPAKFDPVTFRTLCERLNFASILRTFDDFVTPFEKAQPVAKAA